MASLTSRWHLAMCGVAAFNTLVWLRIAATQRCRASRTQLATETTLSTPSAWNAVWSWRLWLAGVYVFACAVRSIWPRHDSDRVCLFDAGLLSSVLLGRSLACIAELAFAALVCGALTQIVRHPRVRSLASLLFAANIVAQSCCNYSVLTRDQRGHVVEECIWMISGAVVTAVAMWALLSRSPTLVASTPGSGAFLRGVALCGPVFVAFMALVDVPMYYRRAMRDAAAGTQFSTLAQGLHEVAACRRVVATDDYWRHEMPWMSLYFSLAVWGSLWVASLDDGDASVATKPEATPPQPPCDAGDVAGKSGATSGARGSGSTRSAVLRRR